MGRKEKYLARLSDVEEVKVFTPAMIRIREVANNPKTSAGDLADAISRDHSLSSKILKLANSAYYSTGQTDIRSLKQAVVAIGFDEIKNLALSVSLFDNFRGEVSEKFRFEAFWAHSLAVGICSLRLANVLMRERQEEAFVAGFLHDLGKLVMSHYTPDDWDGIVDRIDQGFTTAKAEYYQIGTYHTVVGEFIAHKWNFPETITSSMRHHHPLSSEGRQRVGKKGEIVMADIVYLANLLGNIIFRSPLGTRINMDEIKKEAEILFNINTSQFGRMLQSIRKTVNEVADELSVTLSRPIAITDIPENKTEEEIRAEYKIMQRNYVRKLLEIKTSQNLIMHTLQAGSPADVLKMMMMDIVSGNLFERCVVLIADWSEEQLQGFDAKGVKGAKWVQDFIVPFTDHDNILVKLAQTGGYRFIEELDPKKLDGRIDENLIDQLDLTIFGCFTLQLQGRVEAVFIVDNGNSKNFIDEEMLKTINDFAKQIGLIIERLFAG